ncbi:phosphoenolpyruvate--protein phosphotransferase [bacterium]|nr:phosphoenolpyruvate--protein phosphotransferase [bacterium]
MSRTLKGIQVSSGIGIGRAFLIDRRKIKVEKYSVDVRDIQREIERFHKALDLSKKQLLEIKEKLVAEMGKKGHASIVDVHILILEDEMLVREAMKIVEKEHVNAEWALRKVLTQFASFFEAIDDPYIKDRRSDIEHVGERILRNLVGKTISSLDSLDHDVVVIAHDLSPADTAQMHREKVLAFATDMGSKTSHTAITARSLEIPAVVGLESISVSVKTGEPVIVDGNDGIVIINPEPEEFRKYLDKQKHYKYIVSGLLKFKDQPAETLDGYHVELKANIEFFDEIPHVLSRGAEGIGLYRTEFLYMDRKTLPTEEEHFQIYKNLAEQISPYSAVIRTLDLGGDKITSKLHEADEPNPVLGLRAIRFSLKHQDLFMLQLRAILRASAYGKLKILYPMISGIDELRQAKAVLAEVKHELESKGIGFDKGIQEGAMIEIPSAAMTVDLLAKEADFFSIGTNDLIQYSIAIDRGNEHVAYLYEPLHPSVLRSIKKTVTAAHSQGIKVAMCGEMAGDPLCTLILVGMGLDELSMNASSLPVVKKIIRSIRYQQAANLAYCIMTLSSAEEIEGYVGREMGSLFPEFF